MATLPQPAPYRPETAILALGPDFYDAVEPANFPQAILRFRNDRWAAAVGLGHLSDEEWIRHFARFDPLPGNLGEKLALRYHGHQFRVYNPDIGDGRGFLFAQLRDGARGDPDSQLRDGAKAEGAQLRDGAKAEGARLRDGPRGDPGSRLLDLGTKGSGRTPYSRFGDGRLTLKGGVRELLATEMLEALGADTSKTFSLIETGEALDRGDEPSPTRSCVLVRLSHGHIRIGTFQRLAALDQGDNLRKLAAYCLEHFFADASGDAAALMSHVAAGAARLAASYIAAGFVHGVLNSDNINVTAESFDYGPWRWTPFWDGHFTAAYFDHAGLYSFGRQPEAIHWDLVQLARALAAIAPAEALTPALDAFPDRFQHALRDALFARLGLVPDALAADMALVIAIEEALAKRTAHIDRFFFDWRGGALRGAATRYDGDEFAEFRKLVAGREAAPGALDHPYWEDEGPCTMHIDEVEALWAAIDADDDWTPLNAKVAAVRRMGEAHSRALASR